jgi:hypothetical protein
VKSEHLARRVSSTTIGDLRKRSRGDLKCAALVNVGGKLATFCALLAPVHTENRVEGSSAVVLESFISFDPSVPFWLGRAKISRPFYRAFTTITYWKPLLEPYFQARDLQCLPFTQTAHFPRHLPQRKRIEANHMFARASSRVVSRT